LFLVGLEFEIGHLKRSHRAALAISAAGVLVPFLLGWELARLVQPLVDASDAHRGINGFALFMGTAMAITALPVLGRMLLELNITRTRIGTIALSAAAVSDATGWILLAAVSAMVKSQYEPQATLCMVGLAVVFALLMVFFARPILIRWLGWSMRSKSGESPLPRREIGLNTLAILLIIILICAIATSLIGIFAIFGAFLLGVVLSDQHAFRDAVTHQLRNFVTVFFLPIFFTYTGLRTDIGSLGSPLMWMLALAIMLVAIAGKFGGCALAARASGLNWRESFCIGAMMNTRGLMELIVVNVGYDLGILPRSIYCMLVMMSLLTNVMTVPLLRAVKRGTELDVPLASRRARLPDAILST
jgi:Kef-type K+ transport system membrane component KefB